MSSDHVGEKDGENIEKQILVVGDGDLSFSSVLAEQLDLQATKLIASVLESEEQYRAVYRDSSKNIERIKRNGHTVVFNLDVSNPHSETCCNILNLDMIRWNFPHVKGKVNIARNRRLLYDFFTFCGSAQRLRHGGQVHLALFDRQGGAYARNYIEWKQSWKPAIFAAECANLLLTQVLPFEPEYSLSSYKGHDQPFNPKGDKQIYIFTTPNGAISAPKDLQLYSYFSLYIAYSEATNTSHHDNATTWTRHQVLDETFVLTFVQSIVRNGIRVEGKLKRVIQGEILKRQNRESSQNLSNISFAEYQILLFGEKYPMTQAYADSFHRIFEHKIKKLTITQWLGTRRASQVYPSYLLHCQRVENRASDDY